MATRVKHPLVDGAAGSAVNITQLQFKTHIAQLFTVPAKGSTPKNTSKRWLIKTSPSPKRLVHFRFTLVADAHSTIDFYESPTISAAGIQTPSYNTNRALGVPDTDLVVFADPTVSNIGTLLSTDRIGASGNPGNNQGGSTTMTRIEEWILKPDSYYLINAAAHGSDTNFSLTILYYKQDIP